MKAINLAKWFLNTNPSLLGGYRDENTKLNKLLYFSNLMYCSLYGKTLIDEDFEKWDNGPVIREIYKEYRYNKLSNKKILNVEIDDRDALKVLQIINLVYGDMKGSELSDESHKSSIWQEAERNQKINFSNIDPSEKKFMRNLFDSYRNFDFNSFCIEKINGNKYFYDKSNLTMTEELICDLEKMPFKPDPIFIELIDGEVVFS